MLSESGLGYTSSRESRGKKKTTVRKKEREVTVKGKKSTKGGSITKWLGEGTTGDWK